MNKRSLIFIILVLAIFIFPSDSLNAQVIGIQWHTFLGSDDFDISSGIKVDSAGNIFLSGHSTASWGSPINAHAGLYDAFVAKLDSNGNLLWNTFLGSAVNDCCYDIEVDGSGNIYITGYSNATWGIPINAHSGAFDTFIVKLDNNGNLLWNTFLGCGSNDRGYELSYDTAGNIYVIGYSDSTWGTPLNAFAGSSDALIAKLDTNGNLLWHTFLGGSNWDYGYSIILYGSNNTVYITGRCPSSWGTPINSHTGDGNDDAFVARLDSNGNLIWNTFLGSTGNDRGYGIKADGSENIYITGHSLTSWGSPINPIDSNADAFVAKLDANGTLSWNTFLGGSAEDVGWNLTVDSIGNSHVTGYSLDTWGNPINGYTGSSDAFIAKLDSNGNRIWNSFLGSLNGDRGYDITSDSDENIFLTGFSYATWGSPINPYTGSVDAILVKIVPHPIPGITANGSDDPIIITQSDTLQIKVSLISYGLTDKADWWLLTHSPFGWYYYDYSSNKWKPGKNVTRQGRLLDLNPKTVLNTSGLKLGVYRFYFGVDLDMNGEITKSSLYYDEVQVTVTSD